METDPATLVTGTPTGLKSPRVGDVLVERFEITEAVESDCLIHTYQANDQETDASVLVRVTAPGLLGEKDARRLVERMRVLVGATSDLEPSAWPTLLDVDREGALVVTVEKMAPGASFRSVLDSRKSKNKRFSAAELLPVAQRLCAALDGLPSTGPLSAFHHGDLRAQRILVHPDGLTATGAFLLGSLPGDAVADAISRDVAMRRLFAPEVADGLAGRPADRFAVALLIWEALEGKAPPPAPRAKDSSFATMGELLCRYLTPDPAERPSTLRPLVEALAEGGKISWLPDALATRGERIKAKREPSASKDLDPALVAAARAASTISNTGTFKLDDDELMPVTGSGPMPAPSVKPRDVAKAVEKAKASIPPPKLGSLAPGKSKEKQAAKAKSNTPPPKKRKSIPSPERKPQAPRAKPDWEHAPLPKTAPLPAYVERETLVGPAPVPPEESKPERGGTTLVLGAVALALLILGAAFWYRSHQEDARHEREVEAWIHAHQGER
jgi:serine/threonine protein kinase